MGWLSLLPWGAILRGVALVALLLSPYLYGRHQGAAEVQAKWDRATAQAREATIAAEQAARAEESRRDAARTEVLDETQRMANRGRAAAADARAALDGLRQRWAAGASACAAQDPSPAGPGPATGPPGDLPTDVLGRVGEAAVQLAEFADASRTAGLACQRLYDSLTAPRAGDAHGGESAQTATSPSPGS